MLRKPLMAIVAALAFMISVMAFTVGAEAADTGVATPPEELFCAHVSDAARARILASRDTADDVDENGNPIVEPLTEEEEDLVRRITDDVNFRGTCKAFIDGTDQGVLYGVGKAFNTETNILTEVSAYSASPEIFTDESSVRYGDGTTSSVIGHLQRVAKARGAPDHLIPAIIDSVLSRGTVSEFLAGVDTGVIYGVASKEISEDGKSHTETALPGADRETDPKSEEVRGADCTVDGQTYNHGETIEVLSDWHLELAYLSGDLPSDVRSKFHFARNQSECRHGEVVTVREIKVKTCYKVDGAASYIGSPSDPSDSCPRPYDFYSQSACEAHYGSCVSRKRNDGSDSGYWIKA